jgi:uncharacterized membrane protein
MKSLKWIIMSVLLVSIASILLKLGMNEVGKLTFSNLTSLAFVIIKNPFIILGMFCYVLSSFTWLMTLSKTDLSKAYPILSSTYALIPILSWVVFKDVITTVRWLGIAIVCVGIVFMARS